MSFGHSGVRSFCNLYKHVTNGKVEKGISVLVMLCYCAKMKLVKINGQLPNLTWQCHVNDLSVKLNRANAPLFKMRKYVSLKILRQIYFTIFDSYLSYCCLVWAQNCSTIEHTLILQKTAVRIINLKESSYQSPIQAKLHLKIPRLNLPIKYFICHQIFK